MPVVVPVEEINLATVLAVGAACARSRDVRAVHVVMDPDEPSKLAERWRHQFPGVPLVIIDSPYRTVADPIAAYVRTRVREVPHEVHVIVPLLIVRRWYQRPLVNQSLKPLVKLMGREGHVTVERVEVDLRGRHRKATSAGSIV